MRENREEKMRKEKIQNMNWNSPVHTRRKQPCNQKKDLEQAV